MGFASAYLTERALFPRMTGELPREDTGIIIVVPAYDEPGITDMLDSVSGCTPPPCGVEMIVVINAPENASEKSLENNRQTFENITAWKNTHNQCFFRLFCFIAEPKPVVRKWGVGLARKTGMDEAVRRFDSINRPDGIILNLDADCTVSRDYLLAACNDFLVRRDRNACSVYFEHPTKGVQFSPQIYTYITLYELHLRYYLQALAYSGFPYAFHTVGSSSAVRALAYVKAGGMNRRQAGEDFYFIQKLVPAGGYFALNSTTVYPSPRLSFRVPFGTGASVKKMSEAEGPGYLTYNTGAFIDLKLFFRQVSELFQTTHGERDRIIDSFPLSIRSFLPAEELNLAFNEILTNTSGPVSSMKRFFNWFNMFMIVRYLNTTHRGLFDKLPVEECATRLLELKGIKPALTDPVSLLDCYRALEKEC